MGRPCDGTTGERYKCRERIMPEHLDESALIIHYTMHAEVFRDVPKAFRSRCLVSGNIWRTATQHPRCCSQSNRAVL